MIRFVLSVISVNLYNDQTRCFVDRMGKYFSSLLGFRHTDLDREVAMKLAGRLTVENLRWIADLLVECHVIADTVETADAYDGVRKYGGYRTEEPTQHLAAIQSGLLEYNYHLDAQKLRVSDGVGVLEDFGVYQDLPSSEFPQYNYQASSIQ
jgi:hypothetical protein